MADETIDSMGSLGFTPSMIVRCPCGQQCMIGTNAGGIPGVLHEMPMCEQFDKLDAQQFVTYLRKYYEALERPQRIRRRRGLN